MKQIYTYQHIYDSIQENLCLWKPSIALKKNVLTDFKNECNELRNLLTRTLTLGESNSVILAGGRGCGKSSILNVVLDELEEELLLDSQSIVPLNGLIHTDDRLALQQISLSLNTQLNLVSKQTSFSESLNFLLRTFQENRSLKPIIFVIEEFDLFCHHLNQTLLYNLFDITQSAQHTIFVVGLTTRLDVIELLEKRVKSRFSHRQIFVFPTNNFDDFLKCAKKMLCVDSSDEIDSESAVRWNSEIKELFRNDEIRDIFNRLFLVQRDYRSLKSFLSIVMSFTFETMTTPTVENFKCAEKHVNFDSKLKIIESLSSLQIALLIAMKHVDKLYDGEAFNFEMIYRQYTKLSSNHSTITHFEKPVVFKAFDQLRCLELIGWVEGTRASVQREYRLMRLHLTHDQIDKAVKNSQLPTSILQWSNQLIQC